MRRQAVGRGILAHGVPGLGSWLSHLTDGPGAGIGLLMPMLFNPSLGIVAGGIVLGTMSLVRHAWKKGAWKA